MEKLTAVEWLKERLPSLFTNDLGHYKELFEQALEMEKEQIIDFQLFMNENEFISNHLWDFEDMAIKFLNSKKQNL